MSTIVNPYNLIHILGKFYITKITHFADFFLRLTAHQCARSIYHSHQSYWAYHDNLISKFHSFSYFFKAYDINIGNICPIFFRGRGSFK